MHFGKNVEDAFGHPRYLSFYIAGLHIEGFYNPHRRHSRLGQKSPIEYEMINQPAADAA